MNLDPNILRQLQELYANQQTGGSGYNPLTTRIPRIDTPEGQSYWATFSQPGAQGEAGYGNPLEQGSYIGWNTADLDNKQSSGAQYGKDGTYERKAEYAQDKTAQTLLAALAAMGGVYGLGTMMGGAAGAGGELANTLVSSSEFAAPGGVSGAAFGDAGLMYGGADAAAAGSMGMGPMANAGAGGASLGSSLKAGLSAAKDSGLLGPAATLIGAAAGAQGQPGAETTRKLDPRMDPLVFGDNGLFSRVNGLLGAQNPERDAQREKMRKAAQGLLSINPATNPYGVR